MLLKQIEYYLAVVDCGSFSEAAEKCFISQSAVSQQIKALEKELGVELLERHNRTFTLTESGKVFYRKCTVLLNDLKTIVRETQIAERGARTVFRVGYLKCYGGYEFQNAVSEFSEIHPEINLDIVNGNHEDLYEALRDDRVDLGVVLLHVFLRELEEAALCFLHDCCRRRGGGRSSYLKAGSAFFLFLSVR